MSHPALLSELVREHRNNLYREAAHRRHDTTGADAEADAGNGRNGVRYPRRRSRARLGLLLVALGHRLAGLSTAP